MVVWGCVVWCDVCGGVGGASKREAHTTDVFVTVEFGRMHDWTAVTTYSVRTFKTCAYQQISVLESNVTNRMSFASVE